MPYNFNKTALNTPVTASYIDDSGMDAPGRKLLGNVLALVGYDAKLSPNTISRFNSYAEARRHISGANVNALKAVEKAFNPSKEALAPDYIQFVGVGVTETKATATLKDTTSPTALSAITLTAKAARDAGEISVSIVTGTPKNGVPTKNITVDGTTKNGVSYLPLKLAFTANALVLVDANVVISRTSVIITTTGTDAATKTIAITDELTIAQLAAKINADTTGHDAVKGHGVVATAMAPLTAKPATILDSLASTPITTLKLYATTQAVVDAINNTFSDKLTATRATGNVKAVDNANKSLIYTAPVDPTITVDHWAAALTKLEEIDVQWVVPLSDATIAHEAVKAHCNYMTDTAFMERRAIVGAPVNSNTAEAIALAEGLDSDRVSIVHQGFYDGATLYPPYVLASLLGGMICGLTPGTAMTNKTINVTGMDSRLKNPSDTDTLLSGGVLCCWQDFAGNVKVLQSITTTTNDYNFNQREISVGVASDYVARAIRETLDPLRGKKNTPYLSTEVLSRVESRLKQLAIDEPLGEGVLVGDAKNPAYRGITVTTAADSITVEFECSPVIPCNYIGIVVHTVPYIG